MSIVMRGLWNIWDLKHWLIVDQVSCAIHIQEGMEGWSLSIVMRGLSNIRDLKYWLVVDQVTCVFNPAIDNRWFMLEACIVVLEQDTISRGESTKQLTPGHRVGCNLGERDGVLLPWDEVKIYHRVKSDTVSSHNGLLHLSHSVAQPELAQSCVRVSHLRGHEVVAVGVQPEAGDGEGIRRQQCLLRGHHRCTTATNLPGALIQVVESEARVTWGKDRAIRTIPVEGEGDWVGERGSEVHGNEKLGE